MEDNHYSDDGCFSSDTSAGTGKEGTSNGQVWQPVRKHQSQIIKHLNPIVVEFCRHLSKEEVLTVKENETIRAEETPEDKVMTLLSLLSTNKGDGEFLKFCEALKAFGQESLVALLTGTAPGDIFNPVQNVTSPVKPFFQTKDSIAVEQAVQMNRPFVNHPVTVLYGPSGSGKKQICLNIAEKLHQHYPTAVARILDGRDQDSFLRSKMGLLEVLEDLPERLPDNPGIVDKCLKKAFLNRGTPVFLIVENLKDGSLITPELLPLMMYFRMVIITPHNDLQLSEGVRTRSSFIKIQGFQGGEELEHFLKERLPEHDFQGKDFHELNDLFKGLPLGLAIVAEYMHCTHSSLGTCIAMLKKGRTAKILQETVEERWMKQHYDKFESGRLHPAIQVAVDKLARQEQATTGQGTASSQSSQRSNVLSYHVESAQIAGIRQEEQQPTEEPEPSREPSGPKSSNGTGVNPMNEASSGTTEENQATCQGHGNTVVNQQPNEEAKCDSPGNSHDHSEARDEKKVGDACANGQKTEMELEASSTETEWDPSSTGEDQPTQQGSLQDGMESQGASSGGMEGEEQHLAQQLESASWGIPNPNSSKRVRGKRSKKRNRCSRGMQKGSIVEDGDKKNKEQSYSNTGGVQQPWKAAVNSKSIKEESNTVSDEEPVDGTTQPSQKKETQEHNAAAVSQTPQSRRKVKKDSKNPRGFDEHVNRIRMSASRRDKKRKTGSEHASFSDTSSMKGKEGMSKRALDSTKKRRLSSSGKCLSGSRQLTNEATAASISKSGSDEESKIKRPMERGQRAQMHSFAKTTRKSASIRPLAKSSHESEAIKQSTKTTVVKMARSLRKSKDEGKSDAEKRNIPPPDEDTPPTTKVPRSPPPSISDNQGTGVTKSFGPFQGGRDKSYDEMQFSRPPEKKTGESVDESSHADLSESRANEVKRDASTNTETGQLMVESQGEEFPVEYPPSGPPALIHLKDEIHPRCHLTDVSVRSDMYKPQGDESSDSFSSSLQKSVDYYDKGLMLYGVTKPDVVKYVQTCQVYAVPYTSLGDQDPRIHGPAGINTYWLPDWLIGACGAEGIDERNLYLGATETVAGREPNDGVDQQCQRKEGTDYLEDLMVGSLQESLFLDANGWVVSQPKPSKPPEPDPVFVKVLNTAGQILTEVRILGPTYVEDVALYVAGRVFDDQPLVAFTLRWQGGFNIPPLTLLQHDVTLQVHHAPDEDKTWIWRIIPSP